MRRWRHLWLAGALTLAAPVLALEAEYLVSLRTDLRARSPFPDDRLTTVAADLGLLPDLLGGLRWSAARLTLQYNPSFLLRDRVDGSPFVPLHRGRLAFTGTVDRTTLSLLQEAAAGDADVSALGQLDPTGAAASRTVGTLPYVRSSSMVVLDSRPDDRVGLTATAAYLLSGSSGSDVLPLQWGPTAQFRLRWAVSRLDAVSITIQGAAAWFAPLSGRAEGQRQLVAQATETWDRQLSRTLAASLGAGVAVTREVIPPRVDGAGNVVEPRTGDAIPGEYSETLPVALAGLTWREGALTVLGLSARMAPFADRFTGLIYERVEARVQAELRPMQPVIVTAAAWAAFALPLGRGDQAGDRVYSGEATAAWTATKWLTLGATARIAWTEQPRLELPGQLQWAGTGWVAVRDHGTGAW